MSAYLAYLFLLPVLPAVVPADLAASHDKAAAAGAVTLWRADDGLFYVDARINGIAIKLVVDTGASMTVLSPQDARLSGIVTDSSASMETADTAGGSSPVSRVILTRMEVGDTVAHLVTAVVASQPLAFSLLGQDWLARIRSMRIEGDRMTLQ